MEDRKNQTIWARQLLKCISLSLDKVDKGNSWEERDYMMEKIDKLKNELMELTTKLGSQ